MTLPSPNVSSPSFIFSELAMLGSPILDSSLNNCGGNGAAGDLADCYSPKLNDSYRGTKI